MTPPLRSSEPNGHHSHVTSAFYVTTQTWRRYAYCEDCKARGPERATHEEASDDIALLEHRDVAPAEAQSGPRRS